uniref:Uncharacterized protein n=1 Tax=Romanomermis culicivorax TaxID=13658 RepID=A0A915I3U5_ROMCU
MIDMACLPGVNIHKLVKCQLYFDKTRQHSATTAIFNTSTMNGADTSSLRAQQREKFCLLLYRVSDFPTRLLTKLSGCKFRFISNIFVENE